MGLEEQKKLCWECGGEVPFESEQCPFCGAEFEVEAQAEPKSSSYNESTQNLYSTGSSDGSIDDESSASHKTSYSPVEQTDLFSQDREMPPRPLYEPVSSDLYSRTSSEEDENALFHAHGSGDHKTAKQSDENKDSKEEKGSAISKSQMLSLCLIIPGLSLLFFGLGMILFSEEGQLILRWDASYGLFIFTLSALFIYFGARAFRKIGKK